LLEDRDGGGEELIQQRWSKAGSGYDPQVSSELAVRQASAADIGLVTSVITLAFRNDPLWGHALARPGAPPADRWRGRMTATGRPGRAARRSGGHS
jgi:hypothetical protein